MRFKSVIFLLLASILIFSCSKKELKVYPGLCVGEIDKQYVGENIGQVYKIVEKNETSIKVVLYQGKTQSHQEVKKIDYFTNTNNFSYVNVDCPGEAKTESASMSDRVKNINLNFKKGD